ncbi:MAG: heme-binding protein, partial [Methylocystis sp.]
MLIGFMQPRSVDLVHRGAKIYSLPPRGDCEVRDYQAAVAAEVTVVGDQHAAARKGFRLLAGYIFGGNTRRQSIPITAPVAQERANEKIAMTAPVTQTEANGAW